MTKHHGIVGKLFNLDFVHIHKYTHTLAIMSDHFFFGTIRHESIVTVILVFCMNNKRIDLVLKYIYIYKALEWRDQSIYNGLDQDNF